MPKVLVLGSSFVIPDEAHENTHLALLGQDSFILVDCPGRVMMRLRKAGLDPDRLEHVVLTHFHPDHVDGVPMMIMEMWLRRRQKRLCLYGLAHCISRVEHLMNDYDRDTWPNLFPISFNVIDERDDAPVLESDDFRILAAPVKHFIPTMGLRIEHKPSGRVLAYSCDTAPCPGTARLARSADLLIHEAAGSGYGHSSAAEAGEIARQAGARRLALIHYRTGGADVSHLAPEAQAAFGGPVTLCEDLMELEW